MLEGRKEVALYGCFRLTTVPAHREEGGEGGGGRGGGGGGEGVD